MAGTLGPATMILTNARIGIITTADDAPAPDQALTMEVKATRMNVLTTDAISTNTIAILVRRIPTRCFVIHDLICELYAGELPFPDFTRCWLLCPDHFVAVEQAQRIKGQF